LYAVLGVTRDASVEDIHRAYRALARRYHPDVNDDPAAAERFREATEAHEFLSDPANRARYDGYRRAEGSSGRKIRVRRAGRSESGGFADSVVEVEVTVEEAGTGGRRKITVDGRTYEVSFPPGAADGQRIRVSGIGDREVYLLVRLAPDPRFRVEGRDVFVDLLVSPWEAALGALVPVGTPTGPAHVRVPAGSSSGRRLRLRGHGLPSPNQPPGDLFADLRVMVPDRLSDEERDLFQRLAERSPFDPRAGEPRDAGRRPPGWRA
jgi:curved DNA-binding protein